jgi:predicted HicB family RNase H-like nuclease
MDTIAKTKVRTEARLPADVHHWLADRAAHSGTSINAQIIAAVRRQMEHEPPRKGEQNGA